MAALVALAARGWAQPVDDGTGAGLDSTLPASAGQAPAVMTLAPVGTLTALSLGAALTCVQSPLALDGAGRQGVLAPVVGATVIRGSAAASPSVTWVVVPIDRLGGNRGLVTICVPAR